MWLDFEGGSDAKFKASSMIVAVSTSMPQYKALYSQAKELAGYLLKKMEFKKIGTVRASVFPPEVIVRGDGLSSLPECGFYRSQGKHDIVLFAGDTSPMDDQYDFAQFLLGKAQGMGVKELYSVGARWAENPVAPEAEPQACGFATDSLGVAKLKKHGVRILGEEPAPFFASMVVAMAKEAGIRGYKLSVDHGEPSPHVRSVAKLLDILGGMAGFEVDLSELRSKATSSAPPRLGGAGSIYH
ncbi:MAG: PAC2 family protein [Nitrososphaerota archaeon]|nr:PAC2 family protein [Nitrososphaerota archaeon]